MSHLLHGCENGLVHPDNRLRGAVGATIHVGARSIKVDRAEGVEVTGVG
jgi:hypothetical protein